MKTRRRTLTFLLCAVAFCATAPAAIAASPGLRGAKASAMLDGPVGTMARAVAVCPKGTTVLSGGWRTRSPKENGAVSVEESLRQGSRSWRVSGHIAAAGDTDTPHKLIAIATCRPGKAPTAVREFAQLTAGAGMGTVELEASCPVGRYAVGGGFATSLPSGAITGSYRIGGTRWRTQVSLPVDGPATQVPLRTVAYCVKSRPGPVKVDTRHVVVIGDDYQETETNFCRRGYLGSGGFRITGDELSVGELRLPKYSYGAVFARWGVLIRIVGDQEFDLKTFSYCLRR
jgi:hypothetical protein